jgi:hypothetical protein
MIAAPRYTSPVKRNAQARKSFARTSLPWIVFSRARCDAQPHIPSFMNEECCPRGTTGKSAKSVQPSREKYSAFQKWQSGL